MSEMISEITGIDGAKAILYTDHLVIDRTKSASITFTAKGVNAPDKICKTILFRDISSIEFKEFYIPFKEALERDKNRERSVGEKVLAWGKG